ncbi:MAG: hypothetical protein C5S52_05455 [ANME-2 cluster archaeon]|nr:hypothetical protein [ANME-2 cluster archaeon]
MLIGRDITAEPGDIITLPRRIARIWCDHLVVHVTNCRQSVVVGTMGCESNSGTPKIGERLVNIRKGTNGPETKLTEAVTAVTYKSTTKKAFRVRLPHH